MANIFPDGQGADIPAPQLRPTKLMGNTPRHRLELAIGHCLAAGLDNRRASGLVTGEQVRIKGKIHCGVYSRNAGRGRMEAEQSSIVTSICAIYARENWAANRVGHRYAIMI